MSTKDQPAETAIPANANVIIMSAANGFIVKEDGVFQHRMREPQNLVFESMAGLHHFLAEHFTHRAKAVVSDAIPVVRVADLAEQVHVMAAESGILGAAYNMIPGYQPPAQSHNAEAIIAEAKAYTGLLPPDQQRMLAEHKELVDRLANLTAFIHTETFDALPAPERMDMTCQAEHMEKYLKVLGRRIARFQDAAKA